MGTSASVTPATGRDIRHPGVTSGSRWGGKKPTDWTRQRTQEIRDLRTFEKAKKAGELPKLVDCLGGSTLLGLVERGKIYPYPLRRPRELWCDQARFRLRDRHFAALAWVTTAWQLHFAGLVIRHRDMATLLGCCERTAGTVMRELADAGLVVASPFFQREGAGHVRWSCIYRLTKGAASFFGITGRASKNCQATENPLYERDPKSRTKGSPRRGGDSIAATLGASLQPTAQLTGSGSKEPERENGPTTQARSLAMLRKQLGDHVKRVERNLTRTYQAERARMLALDVRHSASSSSAGAGGAGACSCVWRLGHLVSPGLCWPRCESHKQTTGDVSC